MKKALKAELTSLAYQILQLKSAEDISKLKLLSRALYEKLSVLEFAEQHFEGSKPTINASTITTVLEKMESNEALSTSFETKTKTNLKPLAQDPKPQPSIEHIVQETQTDIQLKVNKGEPLSAEDIEYKKRQQQLEALEAKTYVKNDMRDIGGVSFDDLPQFEPVAESQNSKVSKPQEEPIQTKSTKHTTSSKKQKSLNDQLNRGINIGLNDRLAFIKHLFNNNAEDYNRVLSQLNTHQNFEDANTFLETVVKPDYKNWDGKTLYEERFKDIIEKKFS